jgi:prolyl oligopeptidase
MHLIRIFAGGALLALALTGHVRAQDADPYLWLEDLRGKEPMAWVAAHNAATLQALQALPDYQAIAHDVRALMRAEMRLPDVTQHGRYLYNFWTDAQHPRGLWRRTTLDQYRRAAPAWDTVLDLDRLADVEGEKWVWHDARCLAPAGARCLVQLSRGGGDAHVVREFDTRTRTFVKDGFTVPEAKSDVTWIDGDTLLVATDFGAGSLTTSGYPRIVREWRRGTPLGAARTLFEGRLADESVSAWTTPGPARAWQFVTRGLNYNDSELFLRAGARLTKVPKPDSARVHVLGRHLVIALNAEWAVDGRHYPQGALLAIDFRRFMAGARTFDVLFTPTPTSSLEAVTVTHGALLLTVLDDVKNRILEVRHAGGRWTQRTVDAPAFGQLTVAPLDAATSDDYILTVTDFLTSTRTYLARVGTDRRTLLKAAPDAFDATPFTVRQFHATSQDGTQVPYFVVLRKDARLDGTNPTVLNAYGGFQLSMKPRYLGPMGAAWLARGGVYVLANIRGGGEFGPAWHQAAMQGNRQRAFDDFLAVAQDLVAHKITSPRHLGITGRSNGGLLVGAALTQRPDLFNAAVSQVPLLDMRRYSKLLAGASWMAEYGDPDDPAQWAYLGKYSPYHNVHAGTHYPRVLFTTSTSDDRVHPAHARKMAAKMQDQGHDVLYWENTEGGHTGVASVEDEVQWWAMTYSFLLQQLK